MSDWIDEEVDNIGRKQAELEDQAERQRALGQQSPGLWQELVRDVEAAVNKINSTQEILNRLGDKLYYEGGRVDTFKIVKGNFPAVYLTVTTFGRYFQVERKIVTNGQSRTTKDERERIELDLDSNGRIYMKTEQGETLHVQDAVKYLLKPLLNY